MSEITIINYGVGNLISVKNMLTKAGAVDVSISNEPEEIARAKKLILPGVGHFDFGMKKLHESQLVPIIRQCVLENNIPILGICLGAQLMTRRSDEGTSPGLGLIEGETVKFDISEMKNPHKLPHMGWNFVQPSKEVTLWSNMPSDSRFYFVHSYHFMLDNPEDIWLNTYYGYEFCAAFHRNNIFGCQFHPEKSHKYGLRLMKNFIRI